MGSTLGSILQGVGQTGNEIGSGVEAGVNQQHQFMMDYLANQARQRGLDIEQTGQQNQLKLGQGQLDIEKQRLQQSRWQLLPGYQRLPNPSDPSKSMYRYTHIDPITKQQVFTDLESPPVDSPEYKLQSFQDLRDKAKSAGANIPDNILMNIAFGKADTPQDINTKYSSLYNSLIGDESGKKYLAKNYPGGLADFVMSNVKADQKASSGFLTKQEQLDWLTNNPGRTLSGQEVIPQADKMHLDNLQKSQSTYQKMLDDSNKIVAGMGAMGRLFNPDAYAAAVSARDRAATNLQDINSQLNDIRNRQVTPPEAGPTVKTPPNFQNPPVAGAKVLTQAAIEQVAKDHNISVEVATAQAKAKGYTIQ